MENEEELISKYYFKTSYKKEDVSKLPAFNKWKKERESEGEKVVRCPNCWDMNYLLNHQIIFVQYAMEHTANIVSNLV